MGELELILHTIATVVSGIVVIFLFLTVRSSLSLKSGLVYEVGWRLMLPAIFIAAFSLIYALNEGFHDDQNLHEMLEILEMVAEICVILASLSILWIGWKVRKYMEKMTQ